MGDLHAGDQVFDDMGRPCWVIGVSPLLTERACFEITFSDHTRITCDGTHLWTVWDEKQYKRHTSEH